MSPGHVVPLITDQFQCQRLGTTDPLTRKPNLDRLSADCVNRTNMFRSDPQCTPSRVSIQTGCAHRRRT
ncbi:sulfatase-like hydrolase/transferase [Streptomyces acidicola]|uniref:Sulfatase-like hydrolase/transferase n=1 Tax=Streptomyces acidicola TaxID=2596892 RepID=A0A5N8WTP2_9ACTN|nr:sulfatase-like hydrolase/transferase [Streptomyces acidicola]MPY50472.1 sulfatase-like hydrolase/transferase [Streptomyces acidicola]